MPNEPISCPNCGASDICQSAPNSYVCKHCHSNFRWVDPTRITVAHEPSVCACGNFATALCVQCDVPLCTTCKDAIFRQLWETRVRTILCSRCRSERIKEIEEIDEPRIQAGRECGRCFSTQVSGRCFACGVGFCSAHEKECQACHRLFCDIHVLHEALGLKVCKKCYRQLMDAHHARFEKKWWEFWK